MKGRKRERGLKTSSSLHWVFQRFLCRYSGLAIVTWTDKYHLLDYRIEYNAVCSQGYISENIATRLMNLFACVWPSVVKWMQEWVTVQQILHSYSKCKLNTSCAPDTGLTVRDLTLKLTVVSWPFGNFEASDQVVAMIEEFCIESLWTGDGGAFGGRLKFFLGGLHTVPGASLLCLSSDLRTGPSSH